MLIEKTNPQAALIAKAVAQGKQIDKFRYPFWDRTGTIGGAAAATTDQRFFSNPSQLVSNWSGESVCKNFGFEIRAISVSFPPAVAAVDADLLRYEYGLTVTYPNIGVKGVTQLFVPLEKLPAGGGIYCATITADVRAQNGFPLAANQYSFLAEELFLEPNKQFDIRINNLSTTTTAINGGAGIAGVQVMLDGYIFNIEQ